MEMGRSELLNSISLKAVPKHPPFEVRYSGTDLFPGKDAATLSSPCEWLQVAKTFSEKNEGSFLYLFFFPLNKEQSFFLPS